MAINMNVTLSHHLNKIMNVDEKRLLLVFKGFTADMLHQLDYQKLLSIPLTVNIVALDQSKAVMLQEVFANLTTFDGKYLWCTFEEYQMLGKDVLSLYFDVIIFQNNLYYKLFPCLYDIPEKKRLLNTYFDSDVSEGDFEKDDILDVVLKYYGELRKVGDRYYIVYLDESEDVEFFVGIEGQINERALQGDEAAALELSEEEDELLLLTERLLNGDVHSKEILISYKEQIDNHPKRYGERLALMQELFSDYHFILVTKTTSPKRDVNEPEYQHLLKKYWGYDQFRNLRMYKDIHDPNFKKETVLIPQSHIVDDIVKQAEIAYQGGNYKDVFVTSPTGSGKSLMFQIPAIYLAEKYGLMTIVISPLIGLMTDQVQSLINRHVDISATINSEITPAQKIDIKDKIKKGDISILYISPETLLSRSDISQLIGERRVGLFVIDEAHIVTTWGKAFRSDYWYLGSYLQRLRKDMHFPIATFTATAIYGGLEDMYAETRDSLNLINPISYFGYIKRDDVEVRIKRSEQQAVQFKEYLTDKFKILTYRLETFANNGQKSLVYFPTVNLIHDFRNFAKLYGSENLSKHLVYYYGPLQKEKKNAHYQSFKNGETLIMLATKAFGMGIDIPDIVNVYHFAPTGNVCDYVQEIGRAARSLDRGYAYFDFLPKDFVHVNRLHGISTIRKYQLIQVMSKVLNILDRDKNLNHSRNILINAEEFRYIFERGNYSDSDDVDNKLKTALLIIEKDFNAKLGYSPIIARPRNIFAREFFMVRKEKESHILAQYERYFFPIREFKDDAGVFGNIFLFDMKKLWEERYRFISYPQFKYKFHTKDAELNLDFLNHLLPVLQIKMTVNSVSQKSLLAELDRYLDSVAHVLGIYAKNRSYFNIESIASELRKLLERGKYFCENLASILIHSAVNYDRLMRSNANFYTRFINYDESRDGFRIQNSGYASFIDWIRRDTRELITGSTVMNLSKTEIEIYIPKVSREKIEKTFVLLGLLEAMGILLYRVNGGDNPEIFLRINSRLHLERSVKDPQNYENIILNNVYNRHKLSVAMLTFLFKNEVSNEQFWEYIEDYFLGRMPEEVMANVEVATAKIKAY